MLPKARSWHSYRVAKGLSLTKTRGKVRKIPPLRTPYLEGGTGSHQSLSLIFMGDFVMTWIQALVFVTCHVIAWLLISLYFSILFEDYLNQRNKDMIQYPTRKWLIRQRKWRQRKNIALLSYFLLTNRPNLCTPKGYT